MPFKKLITSILALCVSLCVFIVPSYANSPTPTRDTDTVEYIYQPNKNNTGKKPKPSILKTIGKALLIIGSTLVGMCALESGRCVISMWWDHGLHGLANMLRTGEFAEEFGRTWNLTHTLNTMVKLIYIADGCKTITKSS